MTAHGSRAARLWICIGLATAVVLLYAPTRTFDFVNLDDNEYVTENPFVRSGLSAENIRWALTDFRAGHWHPLTWLSLSLDCQLFGLNPGAMHLVNVVLHAAATVLLFLWLSQATAHFGRSAFVAALFALHPLRVESVAWITGRKDVLSGLFLMLTLWTYVGYARHPSWRRYTLVALAFALGLLAKPTLAVLPCALLLLDFWPLRRIAFDATAPWRSLGRLIAEKVPLFLLAAATLTQTMAAQKAAGAIVTGDNVEFSARLANALVSYARYLWLTIWPVHLAAFYPLRPVPTTLAISAAAALAALTLLGCRARHRWPYLLVGWLWFGGTLLPVSGLLQFGGQAMADRYSYIPHIGLLMAAIWGLADLLHKHPRTRIAAGALLLIVAAVRSADQLQYWRNSQTLFEHALEVTPDNFLAHNNLGAALQEAQQLDAAAQHFAEAVRLNPTWPEARNNLGIAYASRGEYAEARAHFAAALRVRPAAPLIENNLATAFAYEGNFDAAIEHYTRAVELSPGYVDAEYGLADALERRGRLSEAERYYARVVEARPGWQPALERLQRVRAALSSSGG